MKFKSILCVSLAAICIVLGEDQQAEEAGQPEADGNYEFGYDIYDPVSNDIKSHHEIRDGENVLGFYTFREADGSIRVVKYKAGPKSGFEAIVEKIKPVHSIGNSIDESEDASTKHEHLEQAHNAVKGETQVYQDTQGGHRSPYVAGLIGSLLNSRKHKNTNSDEEQEYDQEEEDAPQEVIVEVKEKYIPTGKKVQGGIQNPYIIKHKNKAAGTGKKNAYVAPNNNNPAVVRIHQQTNIPDGGQRSQHIVYRVHQGQGHIYGGDPGQSGIINNGQVFLVGGTPTAQNSPTGEAEASNEDEHYEYDDGFIDDGFEPYEDDSDHENFEEEEEEHAADENDKKPAEQ